MENVYYMKQTVGNACGTVAVIHSLANNKDAIAFEGWIVLLIICLTIPQLYELEESYFEKTLRKGENAGSQHFLFFHYVFFFHFLTHTKGPVWVHTTV